MSRPDSRIGIRVCHGGTEQYQQKACRISHFVGQNIEPIGMTRIGTIETQSNCRNNNCQRDKERHPVQVACNICIVCGVRVEQQVCRQCKYRQQGRDCRHGNAESQIGIEQGTPPIRIRPTRTAGNHEQGNAQTWFQLQDIDNSKPKKGQENELTKDPQQDGPFVSNLMFHTTDVHRGRHAKNEGKQQKISHHFQYRNHCLVVVVVVIGSPSKASKTKVNPENRW
mmetsp:Transcript_14391/g.23314  ORF Transcript_14391/g.23314 Transcript_14391/m.23314 type:complete len:225 (-) Transcript_14391:218-892(-)